MSKPSNSDRVLDFHFSIFSDVVSGAKLEEFERPDPIDTTTAQDRLVFNIKER